MLLANASNSACLHPHIRARRPLRERCSILLTVQTSSKNPSQCPVLCYTPASQITPSRVHPEQTNSNSDVPFDHLSRCYHFQEMFEGLLYVALADADKVDTLCLQAGVPFTHVLRIEHVEDPVALGSRSEETMNGVCQAQTLTLKCPRQERRSGYTSLSASQLIAARDYLSLVMPYTGHSVQKMHAPCVNVKLLIVAPAGCAVDVMSVVTCYLAFSSGYHAETVMHYMGEEEYDEVWKARISQQGLDFVERIARII